MVPEAELQQTDAGLVPASVGWFVMNAHDARWFHRPGRGDSLPLTGSDEFEAETYFAKLGMSIQVLSPGEPNSMYHWETEQEDFLVLSGEALLIVEGQERPLRRWDFVHCPPETRHVFVGAGDGACVILAASSRQFQASGPWGYYTLDETARRHNACPDEETQNGDVAYARFPPSQPTRYRDGLLPNYLGVLGSPPRPTWRARHTDARRAPSATAGGEADRQSRGKGPTGETGCFPREASGASVPSGAARTVVCPCSRRRGRSSPATRGRPRLSPVSFG